MFKRYKKNVNYFIGLSLLIILCDFFIVKSSLLQDNNQLLSMALVLDFVVVIPLLLYFLIYRKLSKKFISVLPYCLVGYIALMLLLPQSSQTEIEVVKYIIIPLELAFISYEIYKFSQIIITYRRNRSTDSHPIETLAKSIEENFKNSKLAALLIHEISVCYYIFLAWRKKTYTQAEATSFSCHTNSSWFVIVLFLCKLLIIEGALIHIVLMQWSHIAAWIISLGNVYLILWFIADYREMTLNPILIFKHKIRIQYGLQMLAYIDIDNIESVSMMNYEKIPNNELKTAFIPLAIEPNILITLNNTIKISRMFGRRQLVDRIYLFIDKPREFQIQCNSSIESNNRDRNIES
ncbi:hypothetical protein [Paenibacillus endoradicis]|uniref:hypothetical protein n=1 Tax=Paenibacillus endoradicis TaxID=2972487 RepID=UPI00215912B3|nr:hypothetical protein [Paenibacillus endoradicis]MCR8658992.1 hypothetical protein [Paenibacillus endoradicis]